MSRGESSGGGQSSLGYLFGSEEQRNEAQPTTTLPLPPYGVEIDNTTVNPPNTQLVVTNNRSQLGNIVTVRYIISHFINLHNYAYFVNIIFLYIYITGSSINKSQIGTRWSFIAWILVWR